MDGESICRFNFNHSSDLVCTNFVFEKSKVGESARVAECYKAILVASGKGEALCGAVRFQVEPGTLFFVLRGENYAVSGSDDLADLYISFEGRRARELVDRARAGERDKVFSGQEELLPLWREGIERTAAGNVDLWGEAVLLWSFAAISSSKKEDNGLAAKAARMANEHFTDYELSLFTVADKMGYNAKYLSTLFHRERGVSFTEYVCDLRVRHAAFLMEQGVTSVKNVAQLSGFRDPLYFSKVFKKVEGVSPRAYIERVQREK